MAESGSWKKLTIHTDSGWDGNPGPGGWAFPGNPAGFASAIHHDFGTESPLTFPSRSGALSVLDKITTMELRRSLLAGLPPPVLALIAAGLHLVCAPVQACTIFVLSDTNHALFCNNEDWSEADTRIWFLPAGEGYYGAAYVGFATNGWAQGGLNTKGLAYDWVAGFEEKWEPDPKLPIARGNSSQRMLETCATVKEAIRFYRAHREPGFWRAKILVADKTGASVIIGAKDGQLQVEKESHCRGFGFGKQTLDRALARHPQPTVTDGFKILRDCRQPGQYATRYSNIFDLKSGDIFLYPFPQRDDEVVFNLARELKKGPHYYEMPQIKEQLAQAPRPLPALLQRFPVDAFKPLPDREPKVTAHLRTLLEDAAAGASRADDYGTELWKLVSAKQTEIQANMKLLGNLASMTLVQRSEVKSQSSYLYRLEFAHAILLQRFVLDAQNKVTAAGPEAVEWKPGVKFPKAPSRPVTGIGVKLRVEGENLVVDDIVRDSPAAAQKDLHVGDRILAIAQESGPAEPVHTGKLAQAVARIRGLAGTTVRLTVVSAGEDASRARVISLARAELKTPVY